MHDPIGSPAAAANYLKSIVRPRCIGFEHNCLHVFGALHSHKSIFRIIIDTVELRPAARIKIPFVQCFHNGIPVKGRRVHHRKGFRLLSVIKMRVIVCKCTDQSAIFCPYIPVIGCLVPPGIVGNTRDAVEDFSPG